MAEVMAEFYDGPHATPAPAIDGPVYLGIKNMTEDGHLDLSDIRHISEDDYATWTRRVEPRPGDVVFTYEASLHRYAIIPDGFRGTLGRRVALLRPRPGIVDTRFLLYTFIGPQWRRTVDARLNIGSTVDRLPLVDFPKFPIALPPIATQRKIAAILSAYDELIENNNRRIKVLEEMARRIYREWFVDFRYPGLRGMLLIDSELGPIPRGWEVRTVMELARSGKYAVASGPFGSKLGRSDYRSNGVPVIRGTNLAVGGGFRDDGFVFVSEAKANELASSIARPGDIVVTQRGTVGQVGVIPSSAKYPRYVLSQSQMKVTVDRETARSGYLYAAIRSAEVTDRIQNMAISAGVPHTNLRMLRELTLLAPPLALQNQFEEVVEPLTTLEHQLTSSTSRLSAARDLLLPRLISGEIDVDNLNIELPDAA